MPKFMALYMGRPGAGQPDDATLARGGQAWAEWTARHRAQIVDTGGPLGRTKWVNASGVADVRNDMVAYVIIEAADHDAAARLFDGHPQFTVFPGDGVQIMPMLQAPGFD